MKYTYRILGLLPAPWEDFFPINADGTRDDTRNCVTICTAAEAASDGNPVLANALPVLHEDGFYDAVVNIACIDEDVARLVLADVLGVANPEDIQIVQAGVAISVGS